MSNVLGSGKRQRNRVSTGTSVLGSHRSADESRQTRTASKRAAVDDAVRVPSAAPSSHAKKRPALANLSNQSNVAASRNQGASKASVASAKAKIRPQIQSKDVESQMAGLTVEKEESLIEKSDIRTDALSPPVEEIVCIPSSQGVEQVNDVVTPGTRSTCAAIATVERRALENLHISTGPKLFQNKDGFSGSMLDEQIYANIDTILHDPQLCGLYATDIYQHLRMSELKRRPKIDYMDSVQQDINASMRGVLVDWLIEVGEEYKLVPDTIYLTVTYIDRFLSTNVVSRQRLQLLGVACMLIAAKYEEICAPQVEEFCYITDNTYCKEEVIDMERQVLNHLRFELTAPTTKTFLRRFLRAAHASLDPASLRLEFLGSYLAELTIVEYSFLKYLPSMIAASAVFLAKLTLEVETKPWSATLQHYTGYRASELKECVEELYDLQCNKKGCNLPAIRDKYKQHKFKCASMMGPPRILPAEYFEDS